MNKKAKAEKAGETDEEKRRLDHELDMELEESFPASDVPKIISPRQKSDGSRDDENPGSN